MKSKTYFKYGTLVNNTKLTDNVDFNSEVDLNKIKSVLNDGYGSIPDAFRLGLAAHYDLGPAEVKGNVSGSIGNNPNIKADLEAVLKSKNSRIGAGYRYQGIDGINEDIATKRLFGDTKIGNIGLEGSYSHTKLPFNNKEIVKSVALKYDVDPTTAFKLIHSNVNGNTSNEVVGIYRPSKNTVISANYKKNNDRYDSPSFYGVNFGINY